MSPLGFKVGSLIHTWQRHTCCIFPEISSGATPINSRWPAWQLSWSHPHTCEQALMGLETGIYRAVTLTATLTGTLRLHEQGFKIGKLPVRQWSTVITALILLD